MIAVFVVVLLALLSLSLRSPKDQVEASFIQITSYQESAETFDSDGDSVPDWLEEVAGSDVDDPTSFPKQSDIVLSDDILEEELVYDGPSEFTKDVSRRLLLNIDDVDSLTEEEQIQFISDSTDYYLGKLNERSIPEVVLRVDDEVSRDEVLGAFVRALQETAKFDRPLSEYVVKLFSKNKGILPKASQASAHCTRALELFPRAVPADVFPPYYIVLERFVYICEALSIAISSNRSEDYFFTLLLLNSGALYTPLPEGVTTEEQAAEVNDRLKDAVRETYHRLRRNN